MEEEEGRREKILGSEWMKVRGNNVGKMPGVKWMKER